MRVSRPLLCAALCLPALAHADADWLAGEYEVVVQDRPAPSRYLLVITRDADGRYRDDVYKRAGDADAGSILTRVEPARAVRYAGVQVLSAAEIEAMKEPLLVRARVRCATVDGMLLCLVPDGQTLDIEGETLGPGYFAAGMEVGPIAIRKRPPGAAPTIPMTGATGTR